MAIEFKNAKGTGNIKDNQITCLNNFKKQGWQILLLNNYDEKKEYFKNYWHERKSKTYFCNACQKDIRLNNRSNHKKTKYHLKNANL